MNRATRSRSRSRTRSRSRSTSQSPHHGCTILLGQGTHGKIYKVDDHVVLKEFGRDCRVRKLEYDMQRKVAVVLAASSCAIQVPVLKSEFRETRDKCYFKMSRIPEHHGKMVLLNLFEPSCKRSFPHCHNGIELGICKLRDPPYLLHRNAILDIAYQVGKMFSLLHSNGIDGYDGELYYGGDGHLYFTDFDKMSAFRFEQHANAVRKLDEHTYETFEFTTPKIMARFLYQAVISMSLLPGDDDEELQQHWLRGYASHFPSFDFADQTLIAMKTHYFGLR